MVSPQRSRIIQVFLLSIILSLPVYAVSLFSPSKHTHIERQKESTFVLQSNASSCSELYISGSENDNCGYPAILNGTIPKHLIATIKDTAGVLTPLIWSGNPAPNIQIKSVSYLWPKTENTTNCKSIQFMFYDEEYKNAGVAYLTPGQSGHECVSFEGESVVSYTGVTMVGHISTVL